MSAKRDVVEVPYGKYAGNEFSAPQRLAKITNPTDKQNAAVVFGVLMLHYYETRKVKLMEVDELVFDGLTPYWRLCVYGLTEAPSAEQIRMLSADMNPVTPLNVVFEPTRRSHTLVRGVFLTHALTVHMPSLSPSHAAATKRPTPLESLASDHVEEYPAIVSSHFARTAALLRPKPMTVKSKPVKRRDEDKVSKVRQRFKQRSFLAAAYDAFLGVTLEAVERTVAAQEDETGSPSDDDYDQ